MAKPKVVVIAGPNGAGKSFAAPRLLRNAFGILEFINADQIALGLSAYAPESVAFEAGRLMLKRLRTLAGQKASFAFETTLASRSFAPFLASLQRRGYEIRLYYIYLSSARLARRRVVFRVAQGGHAIPANVIARRFGRSLVNLFELYLPLADQVDFLDNTDGKLAPIATMKRRPSGTRVEVKDQPTWQRLQQQAARARQSRPGV
jgi:predicted ABC-type ATPase